MRPNALLSGLLTLAMLAVALVLAVLAGLGSADWVVEHLHLDRKSTPSVILAVMVSILTGGAVFYAVQAILVRLFFEPDSEK
jgi:hypothetical protein